MPITVNGVVWWPEKSMGRFEARWTPDPQTKISGTILKVVAGSWEHYAVLMLCNGMVVESPKVPWPTFHAAAECAEECVRQRVEFGRFMTGIPILHGRREYVDLNEGCCLTVVRTKSKPETLNLMAWERGHPERPGTITALDTWPADKPVDVSGRMELHATTRLGWVARRQFYLGAVTWDGVEGYSWAIHRPADGAVVMKGPATEWFECLRQMQDGFKELRAEQ